MTIVPDIERQPADVIKRFQEVKLREALRYVAAHSAFYRRLFREHGVDPERVCRIEDLTVIPFTEKSDLQLHNEEFVCVPRARIIDYITTSGTLGDPVTFAMTDADLDRLAYNEQISFACTGAGPGSVFQLMTTIDKRFMAGLAYFLGIRRLGAGIVRVGNGIPELQWDTIRRVRPDTIIVVPSFIPRIIDYAEAHGIDYRASSVRRAVCIGENLREQDFSLNLLGESIRRRWDIELFSTYASTEMATTFTECPYGCGGHHHPELIICELIGDDGLPVADDEAGELVVTTLGVEGMPLVRFKTGDLARFHREPCRCGRTTMRISPIIGRRQHAVRGELRDGSQRQRIRQRPNRDPRRAARTASIRRGQGAEGPLPCTYPRSPRDRRLVARKGAPHQSPGHQPQAGEVYRQTQSPPMNATDQFEDLRPFVADEIPAAMQRIADSEAFDALARYVFPHRDVEEVRRMVRAIRTTDEFQMSVMYHVNLRIICRSITQLTIDGLDALDPAERYLFISNHRDIMLDSSLLQNLLHEAGHRTTEITFGSNLMQGEPATAIGRANKMFKVVRGSNMHDFLADSLHLSEYIRHTLLEKRESIWIAQRNGRTKDGDDRTDRGIVKMFALSDRTNAVRAIRSLRIVPVAVSYQWEPCDILKTRELYLSRDGRKYVKQQGEDLHSILTGILQPKGQVHFAIGQPLDRSLPDTVDARQANAFYRTVADEIDRQIHRNYHLFDNNFIAHDLRSGTSTYADRYTPEARAAFEARMQQMLQEIDGDPAILKAIFLGIYANPVENWGQGRINHR